MSCGALDPRTLLPTALFVEERQPPPLPPRHPQLQSLPQLLQLPWPQPQRSPQRLPPQPPPPDNEGSYILSQEGIDRMYAEDPPSPYRKRQRQRYEG